MFVELTRPFSYLTIRHNSNLPNLVNWWTPTLMSLAIVGIAWGFNLNVDTFGSNGLVSRVLSFVQSLPGFYIAALAAISTFNNPDMDKLMPGNAPTMTVHYNGTLSVVRATRRRFLSSMFAFLTASSLLLTLISIAALGIAEPIKLAIPAYTQIFFKLSFSFGYLVMLFQLTSITFWGLYYLGERLYTPDP